MSSIKKNFIYNTGYRLLLIIIPIITTPYISRVLGASGVGTYSYALSISNYFCVAIKLGLDNYGNRAIAEAKNDFNRLCETFSSIYYFQFALGILVTACYVWFSFYISSDTTLSLIFALTVIASCCDISWFLYGMELFKTIAIRSLAVKILNTICVFLFVRDCDDTLIYCFILVMGILVNQLCAWPIAMRIVRFRKVPIASVVRHLRPNLLLVLSVISVTIYKSVDKIMLGYCDPSKLQVGYYESVEKIINIPLLLVVSLGNVMMPRITNMISSQKGEYKNYIVLSCYYSLLIVSALSFGIMAVADEFVPLFYGPSFEACVPIFFVLFPSCIFIAFANVIRNQFLLPNHMDTQFILSEVVGMFVNLLVNVLLIPRMWALGAAIGTLLAEIVSCVIQVFAVRTEINLRKVLQVCVLPVFGGLIMLTSVSLIGIQNASLLGNLIIKVVIGGSIYLVTTLIGVHIISKMNYPEAKIIMASFKRLFRNKATL